MMYISSLRIILAQLGLFRSQELNSFPIFFKFSLQQCSLRFDLIILLSHIFNDIFKFLLF